MEGPKMTNRPALADLQSLALTPKAANLPNDAAESAPQKAPNRTELEQAVANAQKLIRYGAEREIEIPKDIIDAVFEASLNFGKSGWSAKSESAFWRSVSKLTHIVAPVSIDSIHSTLSKGHGLIAISKATRETILFPY
jgi:hypothetical protein